LVQGLRDPAVAVLKLGVALLELLEQARVGDGDGCLVRERFEQAGLVVSEWADLGPDGDEPTGRRLAVA
jgi:hypothetical protein